MFKLGLFKLRYLYGNLNRCLKYKFIGVIYCFLRRVSIFFKLEDIVRFFF